MTKNKLIKDIKDILKKTNDNNYYNTELKNKILELVKIIARENNIEYETIITYKENQNKFLNNNRVIKYYYMIFKNQQCNFGITITKSKDFLFFLLDNNLKIKNVYCLNYYDFEFFYNVVKDNLNIETIKKQCKKYNFIFERA